MTRCISICRFCVQAGLSETRTFEEVRDLVQALKFLIDRAGGIRKARDERNQTASALIDMEDDRAAFGLYLSGNGSVMEGTRWHVAQKEKQAHDLLSPKAKAVAIWADAEFITPDIRSQLPACMHTYCITLPNAGIIDLQASTMQHI